MSKGPHRPNGHPPRRALAAARVSATLGRVQRMILKRRATTARRFRKSSDSIRFVVLGVLLIDFAALALVNAVIDGSLGGYWVGMAPVFGGILIMIIIVRVARPALYLDWIALGVLEVILGLLLADGPFVYGLSFLLPLFLCFGMLALLRVWIGLTLPPGKGAASLLAGGLAGLFCLSWMIVDQFIISVVEPDTILAVDLLLTGLAIVGFGLSLDHSRDSNSRR